MAEAMEVDSAVNQHQQPLSIDASPVEGQVVSHNDKLFKTIKEGKAFILVPNDAKALRKSPDDKPASQAQSVFYNPIQQFNRDLSVLAIKVFGEDLLESRDRASRKKRELGLSKGNKRKAQEAFEPDAAEPTTTGMPDEPSPNGHDKAPAPNGLSSILSTGSPQSSTEKRMDPTAGGSESKAPHPPQRFRILDALSASGLRALRYAQEIPCATDITANDMSPDAVESIKMNVNYNKLEEKIKAVSGDAVGHLFETLSGVRARKAGSNYYDVIDLDPYGTAAPFLDGALQALRDGGLLCVTFTDAGVWASNGYPEKAFALYGGSPVKGFHSHEAGVRLLLHAVATTGARHGIAIEPLASLSIDYYARLFIRIHKSPADVKLLLGKTMLLYSCDSGCGAWQTQFLGRNTPYKARDGRTLYKHSFAQGPTSQPHCEHCGFKTHINGPMWGGPLHHPTFLQEMLKAVDAADPAVYETKPRMRGMLTTALEESLTGDGGEDGPSTADDGGMAGPRIPQADVAAVEKHPFYFSVNTLAGVIHCSSVPPEAAIRGALRSAGFKVTRSHMKPGSLRTDAPWKFVWHVMREWTRQKAPVKEKNIKSAAPAFHLLQKGSSPATKDGSDANEPKEDMPAVVFDEALGREDARQVVRYQMNPRANWGPMQRAKKQEGD